MHNQYGFCVRIYMGIISILFIIFITITLIVYFVVPQKYRWIVLLTSSIYFYSYIGKRAFITLLCASIFTFFAAKLIEKSTFKTRTRKCALSIAVIMIVGWLAVIKMVIYANWDFKFIVNPLGVSYISFSLIGYLADIYWEKDTADTNVLKFLLYIFFFPKIMQGPITKHKDFAAQLYTGGVISYKNVCFGCQRMIYGYFKKLVVADRIALFTDQVFENVALYPGSILVLAIIMASFQLYCDFSGYMDIVLGFTEMLGLEMDENFKHPFFSKSAAEFWRRWHITLGVWFKDYVYTPIVMSPKVKQIGKWGRKKAGKHFGNSIMKAMALSAVWILTGLWHGTGINYVIWGIFWGGIIILSTVFENAINKLTNSLHINTETFSWKFYQLARTFVLFSLGIMITRVQSYAEMKSIMHNIIFNFAPWTYFNGGIYRIGLNKVDFDIVCISLFIILIISFMQETHGSVRHQIAGLNAPIRWILYALSISVVIFIGIYGVGYNSTGFAYTHF